MPKSSTSMLHQIFGVFRAYSLIASENRRTPYIKAASTNFYVLYIKAVIICIIYVMYIKAVSSLNLLVYSM